ncbi:Unknown protein [Striga hermonthica]|uniref:NB-ARC domain-containing protein n=1 Tax=Striga hermonthica TaxID=68872 RepID=A0A9N7RI86_STRHE|nr:Unknown protein [Striga hermonthica]
MASYAAVISLKQTIDHFLKSSHASIPPHTRKILKAVYKEVQSVQQVLTRLDIHGGSRRSESLSVFDAQLTEALRQTQDVLELHASNQSENSSLHLRELKQDINALIQTMQNTRKDYSRELSNLLTQEDDSEYILSTTDFLGFESKIVGLSEEFHDLRERVVRRISVDADLKHFLLSGMAGIGKTTLAKRIFQDPSVSNLFQLRLWVPIGSGYRLEEILSRSEPAEDLVSEYLEDLVSNSVVMIRQKGSLSHLDLPSYYVIKTCGLHSAFRHLCVREAEGNKFFHIFNLLEDGLVHKTKGHRRLCVHNNVLLGIKDVYNSVGSVPNARSLLCTGPYHHYPVPVCFDRLRLLTVVDALALRFYEFPLEVLKLVQLRYLSLTVNENLPPSISDLRNLEYLIVARHVSIVPSETPSYLPLAIWDMKELKHLQVKGRDLPSPSERGAFLPNLSTLLDKIRHLCIRNCYKLEKFTPEFGMELNRIELIDCGPVVVANAQQIEEQLKNELFRYSFNVRVRSSCEARAAKPVT